MFNLNNTCGLSELLSGANLRNAMQKTEVPNLSLISAGMGIGFFPWEKLEKPTFDVAIVRLNQPLKKEIVLAVGRESAPTPAAAKFHSFALQWVKEQRLP